MITDYSNIISVTTEWAYLVQSSGVTPFSAFSLRELNSSYSGPCVQLYSKTTGLTQDIGFGTNHIIDVAAAEAWAASNGGNAFVRIWYDQMGGNRDRYTEIENRMPQLVAGGTMVTRNGYPAIWFPQNTMTLQTRQAYGTGLTMMPATATFSQVVVQAVPHTNNFLLQWAGGSQYNYVGQSGSGEASVSGWTYGQVNGGTTYINNAALTASVSRDGIYQALSNKTGIIEDYNAAYTWGGQNNLGGYFLAGGAGFDWLGYVAEEIYYENNVIANRANITPYLLPYYSSF